MAHSGAAKWPQPEFSPLMARLLLPRYMSRRHPSSGQTPVTPNLTISARLSLPLPLPEPLSLIFALSLFRFFSLSLYLFAMPMASAKSFTSCHHFLTYVGQGDSKVTETSGHCSSAAQTQQWCGWLAYAVMRQPSACSAILRPVLTGQMRCQSISLGLLVTVVPSVYDESIQIVDIFFFVQKWQILSVDPSQTKLYFEVTISNLKNSFKGHIICLWLNSFVKIHVFRYNIWNWQLKLYLVLHVKPTGTQNKDLRPLLDSFQCHESNGGNIFGKQVFVDNSIFQGKLDCLDLREILITWYLELCFRNWAYS